MKFNDVEAQYYKSSLQRLLMTVQHATYKHT
jgi:hypothetical protein